MGFSSLISDELRQYRRQGWIWATVLEPQGGSSNSPQTHPHPPFSICCCQLVWNKVKKPAGLPDLHRLVSVCTKDLVSLHPSLLPAPSIPLRDSKLSSLPMPDSSGTECLWAHPARHRNHCTDGLPEDFRHKLPLCVLYARNIHHTP